VKEVERRGGSNEVGKSGITEVGRSGRRNNN
jgi:hypothetical protein